MSILELTTLNIRHDHIHLFRCLKQIDDISFPNAPVLSIGTTRGIALNLSKNNVTIILVKNFILIVLLIFGIISPPL